MRKHLLLHLLIPLFVGLVIHFLTAVYVFHKSWTQVWNTLWSIESVILAAGIVLAYLVIMYYLVTKETSIRIAADDLAVLDGALRDARRYFATSTIGMKEWFDPISQVFLANIIGRKIQGRGFDDDRVLLFFRRRHLRDLHSPYLDGYYAQRLAEIHKHFRTPLGFLDPPEVFEILRSLSSNERNQLGCYPGRIVWLGRWCIDRFNLWWWLRCSLPELDFALVEDMKGNKRVLKVTKQGQNVRIRSLRDSAVETYVRLAELIRKQVYGPLSGTPQPDDAHNFIKRFHPFE